MWLWPCVCKCERVREWVCVCVCSALEYACRACVSVCARIWFICHSQFNRTIRITHFILYIFCHFHANTSHLNYLLANIVVTLYFTWLPSKKQYNSIQNAVRRTRFDSVCTPHSLLHRRREKKNVRVQYVLCSAMPLQSRYLRLFFHMYIFRGISCQQ